MGSQNNITEEQREQIKAYLAAGHSKNATAKAVSVAWGTVDKVSREAEDDIEELRIEKKMDFQTKVWEAMEAGLRLGRQKLDLSSKGAKELSSKIDKLIELLQDKDNDVNSKEMIELIKSLNDITNIPLNHISTFVGTMYDKHRLMNDQSTFNLGINDNRERLPDLSAYSLEELNALAEKLAKQSEEE